MGNVCKIIVVTFLCVVLIVNVKCQIVQTYCMQDYSSSELDSLILEFWHNSHEEYPDFPIKSISDLVFGLPWNLDDEINSTYANLHQNSCEVIRVITHTNLDIEQVILFHYGYMHLIDMRNPLPNIIENIKKSDDFSDSFLKKIVEEVSRVHKNNWYLRNEEDMDYGCTIIYDIFDDNELNTETGKSKKYNINEW